MLRVERLVYHRGVVDKVVEHFRGLKSLWIKVDGFPYVLPGQFIMVWLPDYEEIPLSPSLYSSKYVRVTVKDVGFTTHGITNLEVGASIFLRGPYGNGFDVEGEGRYLLVGGGCGAAPIIYVACLLVERGYHVTYVEGVKSYSNQLFIDEAKDLGLEAVLVTEDGTSDYKGLVTSYVEKYVSDYDYVLGCGPEGMLRRLLEICVDSGVRCQLSLERVVKCGVGICGSCTLDGSGRLVCLDGPIFWGEELLESGYLGGFDA